jgi:hypothetical protein
MSPSPSTCGTARLVEAATALKREARALLDSEDRSDRTIGCAFNSRTETALSGRHQPEGRKQGTEHGRNPIHRLFDAIHGGAFNVSATTRAVASVPNRNLFFRSEERLTFERRIPWFNLRLCQRTWPLQNSGLVITPMEFGQRRSHPLSIYFTRLKLPIYPFVPQPPNG